MTTNNKNIEAEQNKLTVQKNPNPISDNKQPAEATKLKIIAESERPAKIICVDELIETINDVEKLQAIMGPEQGKVGETLSFELLACDDANRTFQKGSPNWAINQGQLSIRGYHAKIKPAVAGPLIISASVVNKHGKKLTIERQIKIMPAEIVKKPEDPNMRPVVAEKTITTEPVGTSQKPQENPNNLEISDQPRRTLLSEKDTSVEERKQQIMMETPTKNFLAKTVELTEPVHNTDAWVGGGSYAAMYLVAEAFSEGRYRDGFICLGFALLMIIAKHNMSKGPLTQFLETSGKQAKQAYEDIRKSLRVGKQ